MGALPAASVTSLPHVNPHAPLTPAERRWRLILTTILALYGWRILSDPSVYRWIDSLDLAIHETGHLIFGFAGETLAILGGSLFQLLVPALFAFALWSRGDRHGATVPLWWLGQSFGNVSVYVRDARAQELPLVGGGEHDWFMLLEKWDWLARDQEIGRFVHALGFVAYAVAIIGGWTLLYRSRYHQGDDAARNMQREQPQRAR